MYLQCHIGVKEIDRNSDWRDTTITIDFTW